MTIGTMSFDGTRYNISIIFFFDADCIMTLKNLKHKNHPGNCINFILKRFFLYVSHKRGNRTDRTTSKGFRIQSILPTLQYNIYVNSAPAYFIDTLTPFLKKTK